MRTFAPLLTLPLLAAALPAQDGSIAIRAGKAVLPDGSTLENVTLVVQDGRITAFGAGELEVPFDVLLHEAPDATLFAGFYEAHASAGLDRPNENIPIAPFLDVKDSIDPVSFFFEDSLRQGTLGIGVIPGNDTVIGGRGRVVAPFGMTVEQMTLSEGMGMKVAFGPRRGWSRATQLAELREVTAGLDRTLREMGQRLLDGKDAKADADRLLTDEERKKRKDDQAWNRVESVVTYGEDFPGKKLISNLDLDDAQYGMVRILNGEERLWVWAPTATDVALAKAWLEERKLLANCVFVVTSAAWKAADLLAGAGLGVVIDGDPWHVERDPVTWKEVRTFAPAKFHEQGIAFAVSSDPGRVGPDRLGYQAALCLREGLPRAAAMAAVSTAPAKFWGLEKRLASFESGADGSCVLLDGDPLAAGTHVLAAWIRGVQVYDRAKDPRLQRLLEGVQQ